MLRMASFTKLGGGAGGVVGLLAGGFLLALTEVPR